jgi:uncharacterized protein (TIGR03663 family)
MAPSVRTALFGIAILGAVLCALALRLPDLAGRPLHGDEANQTHRTGKLLDTGVYEYDPLENHGPTLYYLTLPVAWLTGVDSFANSTEHTYRIVPLLFGVALIPLLLLTADGLGRGATSLAAFLIALSPAMAFYSRYYIQEMSLVWFTFAAIACGWRYYKRPSVGWAVGVGLCLGLTHATKETCIIAFAAMGGALVVTWFLERRAAGTGDGTPVTFRWSHLGLCVGAAALISIVFFTSFLTHARGPLDSLLTYGTYFERAEGVGSSGLHEKPWHYYLKLLAYSKLGPGVWWSEGLVLVLALCGFIAILINRPRIAEHQRKFLRFLALFALSMTVAYALIPYKTPWNLLPFYLPLILMAGFGGVALMDWLRLKPLQGIAALMLALGLYHLGAQAYRANFEYSADRRNPYVYAHPTESFLRLPKRADDLAQVHPDGYNMRIHVIMPGGDYWPLPWYLRKFPHVGYWAEIPEHPDADLIITSPKLQEALALELDREYLVEFHGLRPDVLLHAYIEQGLWDAFMETRR